MPKTWCWRLIWYWTMHLQSRMCLGSTFRLEEHYHSRYSYCTTEPYNCNMTRMTNCWRTTGPQPRSLLHLESAASHCQRLHRPGFHLAVAWAMPEDFIAEFTKNLSTFTIAEVPFCHGVFCKSFPSPASSIFNCALNTALRLVFRKKNSFPGCLQC